MAIKLNDSIEWLLNSKCVIGWIKESEEVPSLHACPIHPWVLASVQSWPELIPFPWWWKCTYYWFIASWHHIPLHCHAWNGFCKRFFLSPGTMLSFVNRGQRRNPPGRGFSSQFRGAFLSLFLWCLAILPQNGQWRWRPAGFSGPTAGSFLESWLLCELSSIPVGGFQVSSVGASDTFPANSTAASAGRFYWCPVMVPCPPALALWLQSNFCSMQ